MSFQVVLEFNLLYIVWWSFGKALRGYVCKGMVMENFEEFYTNSGVIFFLDGCNISFFQMTILNRLIRLYKEENGHMFHISSCCIVSQNKLKRAEVNCVERKSLSIFWFMKSFMFDIETRYRHISFIFSLFQRFQENCFVKIEKIDLISMVIEVFYALWIRWLWNIDFWE